MVYVDDIILTENDLMGIHTIKEQLSLEFEVKDLGILKYFLGMEVARTREGISVSQRKYIVDLLQEICMFGCKPTPTSLEPRYKQRELWDKISTDMLSYQRLVGKFIYLSHTRSYICYAVSFVSQFMHDSINEHLKAVMRISGI